MARTGGYAEIARHYRDKIRSGELQPGDQLPTIRDVMATWSVSSATAARAYKELKAEGWTTGAAGAGTVVSTQASSNAASRVRTYAETGRALAANETSQVLEVGRVGADEAIAARLEVAPGSPVHMRRRLVSRNNVPVHLSTSYYPAYVIDATPELLQPVSTGASRELAAERLDTAQDHVVEEVTSRVANETERDALGLSGTVVVTQVLRTVYLTDGRVVEVAVKICNGQTVLRWATPLGR